MRKTLLMTSLAVNMILAGNVWAGSCGQGCTWEKDGTKLIITATEGAVMDDYTDFFNEDRTIATTAPWSGIGITEVEIIGGLTNISNSAFEGMNLKSITIPDTVTSIGVDAFSWNPELADITIPCSVTSVGKWAFAIDTSLQNITFPSSVTSIGDYVVQKNSGINIVVENPNATITSQAFSLTTDAHIYCQNFEQCANKGIDDNNIMIFSKTTDGIYQVGTGDDAKYFASSSLMTAGNEKACSSLEQCQEIAAAIQSGRNFRIGGKLYSSVNDFLSGKNIQKRIYTIEEATKLSKDTGNKIMLRYK